MKLGPTRRTVIAGSLAGVGAVTLGSSTGRVAQAAPSKDDLIAMLKVVDDRQRNNGDWRALGYMEQKEKDKVDVVYEMLYFRRSQDQRIMILFTKPKASQ